MPRLFETDEAAARRKKLAAREQALLENLASVLATPAGMEVFYWLLDGMGMGRQIDCDRLPKRNDALAIMARIAEASPEAARKLATRLLGLD